jgi:hypothetical protein
VFAQSGSKLVVPVFEIGLNVCCARIDLTSLDQAQASLLVIEVDTAILGNQQTWVGFSSLVDHNDATVDMSLMLLCVRSD